MYQTFNVTARPEQGPPRLAALRGIFPEQGLDGYLIPRADVHQSEYVSDNDKRLAWLTGFTGSAGFCAALKDVAGVFVDGRYRTQVKAQVDLDHFTPVDWPEVKLAGWLRDQLSDGGIVGYDAWLHTVAEIDQLTNALDGSEIGLKACDDLVGALWTDRPNPPQGQVKVHPDKFAGESHASKRARLAQALREAGQTGAVLTQPDSICWLLNIRGSDVAHIPLVQCFAVLHADGRASLFIDPAKLDDTVRDHLGGEVEIVPMEEFSNTLIAITGPLRVDRNTAPAKVRELLENAGVSHEWSEDPCLLPKACKNAAEIEGSAQAHLRDGAAVVELLAWLDTQAPGSLTEIDVVTRLESCRRKDNALQDISFETISGTGPNGAIMHYRVTEETNARIEDGHLLVLDSGGQYLDGTTDITRTIAIGKPGDEERAAFTRVLQGMIAMSRLRWPKGLAGRDIEAIGRYPLWLAHQDFNHGLGHGVGAYLSVHEGPQRLSRVSHVPLEAGMILSNEPGYYREGAFGIRIENLIVVQKAELLPGGDDERAMLCWRNLTWAPIDRRLIVAEMLSTEERAWLNAYHAETEALIGPRVGEEARAWLADATAPI